MKRQSVVRRDLRKNARYVVPPPTASGTFSRPSTTGATNGGGYNTHRLIKQMEQIRLQAAIDSVFSLKFDVHGDRLSTIIRTPDDCD